MKTRNIKTLQIAFATSNLLNIGLILMAGLLPIIGSKKRRFVREVFDGKDKLHEALILLMLFSIASTVLTILFFRLRKEQNTPALYMIGLFSMTFSLMYFVCFLLSNNFLWKVLF